MIVCKTLGEILNKNEAFCQGLKEAKLGERLSNISHAIQKYVVA
jgi:methionine aminopeptidase